jgi:hypothetical protein
MSGQFAVILDGISLQHAGELLFDSVVSRKYRNVCRRIYLFALEDYAFASLLGDVIMVSGNLPDVKGDKPGETLASLNSRITAIERGQQLPDISKLILEEEFRGAVREDIIRLNQAYGPSFKSWNQFFLREADVYLGDDECLSAANIDPRRYKYAKRVQGVSREEYYLREDDLQEIIPGDFQNSIFTFLRPQIDRRTVCDALSKVVHVSPLSHARHCVVLIVTRIPKCWSS